MTPKSRRKGPSKEEYAEFARKAQAAKIRFHLEILAKDIIAMGIAMVDHGHLGGVDSLKNVKQALGILTEATDAAIARCPVL